MASSCSISRYIFCLLSLLTLTRVSSSTTPTTFSSEQFASFEYQRFDNDSNFNSQITLSGDAVKDTATSSLQITGSWNWSSGRMMYKKPIKLAEPNDRRLKYSFGTHFTFSISPESGDGLAFILVPESSDSGSSLSNAYHGDGTSFGLKYELVERKITAFAVEFDTKMDPEYGDMNGNHIGIDVGGLVSVKVTNASKAKVVLNSGEKISCWIDYEASSKRVEVRLISEEGSTTLERPIDPVLSCPIDLSEMFKKKSVFVGLSSSNGNSTQVSRVWSWGFKLRPVPYWTHSQPLDPEAVLGNKDVKRPEVAGMMVRKSECVLRVVTAVFVGTGCGALGAFVVLMIWSMFGNRRPVVPETQFVEYDCDKVKVLVADDGDKVKVEEDQVRMMK